MSSLLSSSSEESELDEEDPDFLSYEPFFSSAWASFSAGDSSLDLASGS